MPMRTRAKSFLVIRTGVLPLALCVSAFAWASSARADDTVAAAPTDVPQQAAVAAAPAPAASPAHTKVHPFKTLIGHGFDHLTALALPPAEASTPTVTAVRDQQIEVIGKGHFTDAPLPDDDDGGPQEQKDLTSPSIEPSFFHRDPHQVGDALAGGSAANQQRRGHGQAAAGLALAIPLN
ncbi:hypothetical protein [Tanticharoenia sakaeratensis]|nr:hypothetical protein [Tanticharoenia sakaeratensis]